MQKALLFFFLLLFSCTTDSNLEKNFVIQTVFQRDQGDSHFEPIYRIKIPQSWKIEPPSGSIQDTRLANLTFYIGNYEDPIIMTIHTFPFIKLEDRIPATAQVHRWKRQFTQIEEASLCAECETRGGFGGIFFQASGTFKQSKEAISILAWSMHLDDRFYAALLATKKEALADYTIKIIGKKESVEKYQEELLEAARSFELIEAIPYML